MTTMPLPDLPTASRPVPIPVSFCPACGARVDLADRAPIPGDLTFCSKCDALLQFDAALVRHEVSAAGEDALSDRMKLEVARMRLDLRDLRRQQARRMP